MCLLYKCLLKVDFFINIAFILFSAKLVPANKQRALQGCVMGMMYHWTCECVILCYLQTGCASSGRLAVRRCAHSLKLVTL